MFLGSVSDVSAASELSEVQAEASKATPHNAIDNLYR